MRFSAAHAAVRLLATGQWQTALYRVSTRLRGLDLRFMDVNLLDADPQRVKHYDDSGGPELERIARDLGVLPSDTLLDLGCGKAGAILTFARFPFAQVDGVEICGKLVEIARANLRKMNATNASIFHCDAAYFKDLDRYNFFYMYNPFPTVVLRSVMQNIECSLRRRHRVVILVYMTPVGHDLILEAGFKKVSEYNLSHRTFIYLRA